jgi:hypothetical protein
MQRTPGTLLRSRSRRRTDAEGELIDAPAGLLAVWLVLAVLTALEAASELGWIGGPSSLYQVWFHDIVLVAAAALMLARAAFEPTARRAWLALGMAMAVWSVGTVLWSLVYGGQPHPPYPTFADVFWLLWYPLTVAGLVLLIRVRFRRFELHRWMDGIAVMLIVLVAGFALVVQPVAEASTQGWLATIVDFTYPVLDILLIGAVLGVYGLLGWRPDAMWVLIGVGILAMTSGDAAFAVQQARGVVVGGNYAVVWTIGALVIAYAAWVRAPSTHEGHEPVTGMRAIALALIAQALAIAIQITALFEELGKSERIVTAIVLVIASIQLIVSRPKAQASTSVSEPGTVSEQVDNADHADQGTRHGLL